MGYWYANRVNEMCIDGIGMEIFEGNLFDGDKGLRWNLRNVVRTFCVRVYK